jgi:hypothetical protein
VAPQVRVPDPIGLYISEVVFPLADLMLSDEGYSLAVSAMRKLAPYRVL